MQIHEDEQLSEEEDTIVEDTVALEKQLAWSEHRMRELEILVESTVSLNHVSDSCLHACSYCITRDVGGTRVMHLSIHGHLICMVYGLIQSALHF